MYYLFLDTETSGKVPGKHVILQGYFAIYNDKLEFVDELELFLKPDEGDILFEQEAIDVTGINLSDHLINPRTITYTSGKEKLLQFLTKHKIPGKKRSFRLSGQNVDFDKNFIVDHLVDEEDWDKLVHYNTIDTLRITTFLQDVGFIPVDLGSLSSLVEYFGLNVGNAHNAKEDVKMTVELYKSLKMMMQDKKGSISGVSEHNLLSIIELQ